MRKTKIYVASSWRNPYHGGVVAVLQSLGHAVYNFKMPPNGNPGFDWAEIDPNWQQWTNEQYRENLMHPTALRGFNNDFAGMQWAESCLLLLPCGRSAHSEAGYMKGSGKKVFVFCTERQEPELMYHLFDEIICGPLELNQFFKIDKR